MSHQLFINLPVTNVEASKAFYTSLGWTLNPDFSDDNAAAIVVSETIHLMVLSHDHFRQFTSKEIADTTSTTAAIHALSVEAPEDIDSLLARAVDAGATEGMTQDHGFMRSRSFADPDGHEWEVMWMDPIAAAGDWDAVQQKYSQPSDA
ncbi:MULTISPECIES: VOC family protein [unclassified Arthrobacter]|uniref:VOC family protein n=1 Tax=unclassified Arthrobacter TaxID=235627 RepID=UPI001491F98A|nr:MULTISPECIES: VOC family protein [unclassified Arthrobacter]MBE0010387.1 glyoxalase [Arthrobacter sp. AET 35A]NOJ64290.1 glyoxalase [Arthrobacter sp. 147(2020)]